MTDMLIAKTGLTKVRKIAEYTTATGSEMLWVIGIPGSVNDRLPWTTGADSWEPYTPTPKPGQVWTAASSDREYRVLGVDEEAGVYHIVQLDKFAGGTYPDARAIKENTRNNGVQYWDSSNSNDHNPIEVYTRTLPEEHLTYVRER